MNKVIGRLLLLIAALAIAGVLGYYFLSKEMGVTEIILLGTAFMLLGEMTYRIDKKLFQNDK